MTTETTCLSLEDVAALAEGRLAGAERERAVAHLAGCEDCRDLFAEVVAVAAEVEGEVGSGEPQASRPVPQRVSTIAERRSRRWLAPISGLAATLTLVGAVVVYRSLTPPRPPSRAEWLATMPPAEQLLPELWGGIVMRGSEDSGELARQSAELGALLVDIEVALAAEDGERAAELARRMAVIVEQAGLMDEEVAALRDAAGAPIDERSASLRRVLIGSEEVLRRRFLALPWELATLAEQTRLSARAGRADFLAGARVQRFIDWTLEQQDAEVLSAEVRDAVGDLREAADEPPEGQEQAAAALLAALTRG